MGDHQRSPIHEAICAVKQTLQLHGLSSDWTSSLALRLRGASEASSVLRRVLERHGWSRGQFTGPPDRQKLLCDLEGLYRRQAATSLELRPDDNSACRAEERRFERQYELEEKPVGEGTYGAVYKAKCTVTHRTVAVKRVKMDHDEEGVPSTAIREVAVLKNADHPHIVKLLDVCCAPGKLHLIFEFVDLNLKQFMKRLNQRLEPSLVRNLQHQLLRGIDFCHSKRILHRDLKPQNILIDGRECLKIADFGMARAFCIPIPKYTHEVVTTWYRAPEILFGCEQYSLPVDVWSAGCILGEIATGAALFHGDSEIDTIFQIFKKLGTPLQAEWPGLAALPDFKPTFPKWSRKPWAEVRNTAAQLGQAGMQLLDHLLRYDPQKRISARAALQSEYFGIPQLSDVHMRD